MLLYVADLCPGLTITHFYGTKEPEKESESPVIEEAASLAEVVKKRRLLAAKAIEEKAQREREEAERWGLPSFYAEISISRVHMGP